MKSSLRPTFTKLHSKRSNRKVLWLYFSSQSVKTDRNLYSRQSCHKAHKALKDRNLVAQRTKRSRHFTERTKILRYKSYSSERGKCKMWHPATRCECFQTKNKLPRHQQCRWWSVLKRYSRMFESSLPSWAPSRHHRDCASAWQTLYSHHQRLIGNNSQWLYQHEYYTGHSV